MSKKTPLKPIVPNTLPRLLKELIEDGLTRREEVRQSLSGGLLLKFRPPDETSVNCRLVVYRLDVEPSAVECGVVQRELCKVVDSPVNGPSKPFWHKNFGCYLFTWSPDPQKVQLELFGGVA